MFCTVSAYGWKTYDYSRFNSNTYLYDIGGNFKNTNLEYYNGVLSSMKSEYGITYTFIIVNDYNDSAMELADYIWENAGYSWDYISAVISVQNRDLDVYTQGKGISVMNDSYVNGMLDALEADLKKDDWDSALLTFIDLAEKMTVSYIDDTQSVTDRHGNTIYVNPFNVFSLIMWILIPGIIMTVILLAIELGKHKPVKKAVNADYYVEDNNVNMSLIQDSYLRSHEVRTRVNNSSGGGGGRGGGNTRSGSSGRSFGGGSRKF